MWFRRISTRIALGVFVMQLCTATTHFYVLLGGFGTQWILGNTTAVATTAPLRLWIVLAMPAVLGALFWMFVASYMLRKRIAPFVATLTRFANGEFDTELPRAPELDLRPVGAAFDRMKTQLQEAMRALKHQDAQRRRLFADLAHELGTPITSQMGLVDALRGPRGDNVTERNRLLLAMERETERLQRLVQDLRELALLDDPDSSWHTTEEDLAEVVRHAITPFAENTVGPRIECELQPCRVSIDRPRVEQVVANLLSNAKRYAGNAGVVRVTVQPSALLVVEDDGPGVPTEMLSRLGERMLRVDATRDRKTGGAGLGLSIVHAIVHRHGGTVQFSKSSKGGLCIHVQFPRKNAV